MHNLLTRDTQSRERLLRSESGWWLLGAGGWAKLRDHHVTADRRLDPAIEDQLRRTGMFDVKPYRSYSLTVLTSTQCNLGCGYCFQNIGQDLTGGSAPPRIARARLTTETITEVLAFTRRNMAEAGLDQLLVQLFGGEPLLNPQGCVDLLAAAGDCGLAGATMTSNGTLLTVAIARRLEALGLRSVQVTFDGDQPEHDLIRVRRSGTGTFDAIVGNLARVTDATELTFDLRINLSHHNKSSVGRLLDRLAERLDPARCVLTLAPVCDVGVGYLNDMCATELLAAEYLGWLTQAHGLGFRIPRPKARQPCPACYYRDGRYGAVVNADGTLYSCWETAGKAGWDVGTVRDGYRPSGATADRWSSCVDQHQHNGTEDDQQAFLDAVDGGLLDFLERVG